MIKINVNGTRNSFSFNEKRIIKRVVKAVFKELNIKTSHEINFLLTDLETIHEYNLTYRNKDMPTDIISFAYIDSEENETIPFELGDIIICIEKVKSQADDYGHSEKREFAFLVTHGMLHLLGYDHLNVHDEKVMFELQDVILNRIKILRDKK